MSLQKSTKRYLLSLVVVMAVSPCSVIAQEGDCDKIINLEDGNITEKLVSTCTEKANQGNATAQYNLGQIYHSDSIMMDFEKAIFWYKKAADQNFTEAYYGLGRLFSVQKEYLIYDFLSPKEKNLLDINKGIKWLEKAAENDDVRAMLTLTDIYDLPYEGVTQDYEKAAYWLTEVAKQGDSIAQFRLGIEYINGEIVEQSDEKAIYWLKKSAEQGNQNAIYELEDITQDN